ncbi:caspase family protein [Pseudomonas sp. GT1P32]
MVIGNGTYSESSLAFATADAQAMAQALQSAGFAVTLAKDLNTVDMRMALDEFVAHASNADAVLFYFAGHGVQVQNNTEYRNYLLPTDISPSAPGNIIQNGIDVESDVLKRLASNLHSHTTIVILDACRLRALSSSQSVGITLSAKGSSGLARMSVPSGTFVAYATAPGQRALEDTAALPKHGTYTGALLEHITTPGIMIEQVFKRTRSDVELATHGAQSPREESSLRGDQDFFFLDTSVNRTQSPITVRSGSTASSPSNTEAGSAIELMISSIRQAPREQRMRTLARLLENRSFTLQPADIRELLRSFWIAARPKVLQLLDPALPRTIEPSQLLEYSYLIDRRDLVELLRDYDEKRRISAPSSPTLDILEESMSRARSQGACAVAEAQSVNRPATAPTALNAQRLLGELGNDPQTMRLALHELLQQNEVALSYEEAMSVLKAFPDSARGPAFDELLQLFPDRMSPQELVGVSAALGAHAPDPQNFFSITWRVDGKPTAEQRQQITQPIMKSAGSGDVFAPILDKYCPEQQTPLQYLVGMQMNSMEYQYQLGSDGKYWELLDIQDRLEFVRSRPPKERGMALMYAGFAKPTLHFNVSDLEPIHDGSVTDKELQDAISMYQRHGNLLLPLSAIEVAMIRSWFSEADARNLLKDLEARN